jgi:hypothetical protein
MVVFEPLGCIRIEPALALVIFGFVEELWRRAIIAFIQPTGELVRGVPSLHTYYTAQAKCILDRVAYHICKSHTKDIPESGRGFSWESVKGIKEAQKDGGAADDIGQVPHEELLKRFYEFAHL